jgi:hypothetical protein
MIVKYSVPQQYEKYSEAALTKPTLLSILKMRERLIGPAPGFGQPSCYYFHPPVSILLPFLKKYSITRHHFAGTYSKVK